MRTGDVVDLASERRLSAVLSFAAHGAELLLLNGGSRAEEVTVETLINAPTRRQRRAAYCIDSGTSMQLVFPLLADEQPSDVTIRIVGSLGEMLLAPPPRPKVVHMPSVRASAAIASAAVFLLVAGGHLAPSLQAASADPEPAPVEAPLVRPKLSLHVPGHLPRVIAQASFVHTVTPYARQRLATRHARIVAVAALKSHVRHVLDPQMTDLRVPQMVQSGDIVPIAFNAIAQQVKIVASIGPTVVSKTIIGAQRGMIAIRSPKSDRNSRVMTVRAYAQNGDRTSVLTAMVILVRP